MEKSRIIELMAKKTGNSASDEELSELAALLSRYPDYAYLQEIVLSLKGSRNHFERNIPREELVNHGWQHLTDRLNTEPGNEVESGLPNERSFSNQFHLYLRRWAAAAAIFVCACASLLYYRSYYNKSQSATVSKTAVVHNGSTSEITLSDGTRVRLNAGSKLIYPEHFSNTSREVTLEGEAFFEVTQSANAPFLVHAGKIKVRVLGTRFNIKAYKEDADIETTLISGKVQVMLNDDEEKKIMLFPHEKLTVINEPKSDPVKVRAPEVSNELRYQVQVLPAAVNNNYVETAWLDHKMVLSNEDFENVARLLERKYDVTVYFDNSALKQEHISGVFEKENITQVLEILKMTTRFNYRINGNEIHLF
ncbi:MAG: FecR family protein [Bacteroidota bacterium]|nr:FecR family protein [Bacteroidota bacterium]MDP4251045.1 FecR family protein [Bacteroidota bacterium]